jgi:hypothetical protein
VSKQPNRRWPHRLILLLVIGFLLLLAALAISAVRLRFLAQALLASTSEIHSNADAEHMIATWRNRQDSHFSDEPALPDGDHSYTFQVENAPLHQLRIVPPTLVSMSITMRNGVLRSITLVMFTGREPNETSGVWIQEWFGVGTSADLRVNDKRSPWKDIVDLSSAVPENKRRKAFALNTNCFIRPGGCRCAQDILPGVWQLGEPASSRVHP